MRASRLTMDGKMFPSHVDSEPSAIVGREHFPDYSPRASFSSGMESSSLLAALDPKTNRSVYSIALRDPNPIVARQAAKLAAHKGFETWRK